MPLRLATVFSGIGAIEFALKRMNVNHEIIFACDNDKYVKESYFANYNISEEKWFEDILEIDGKKFKEKVDLFVGGSPCQSFSFVGDQGGLEDPRGLLIYEFARLVHDIEPEIFIYENVVGLLNVNEGRDWIEIQKVLNTFNYQLHIAVINSKDFGIPQHRKRLFIVGFKNQNTVFSFPQKSNLKIKMHDLLEDRGDRQYDGLRDVSVDFNLLGEFYLEASKSINDDYFDTFFISQKIIDYITSTGTKNFYSEPELDLDVARPLLKTMHKMHRAGVDNYMQYNQLNGIRKLTPRECLRLMGFDDRFKIAVSNTRMYMHAGNSIVVDVLIHILNQIDLIKFDPDWVKGPDIERKEEKVEQIFIQTSLEDYSFLKAIASQNN